MKKQKRNKRTEQKRDEEQDLRGRKKEFRRKRAESDLKMDDAGSESSYLSKA